MRNQKLLLLFVLLTKNSYALPPPAWPLGPVAELPAGEYILSGNTTLKYDKLTINNGTTITTFKHDLDLEIREELVIKGNAVIRAFNPSNPAHMPPIPPEPQKAPIGLSFDRGPRTEGSQVGTNGADGEDGKEGQAGTKGATGYDAGFITLRLGPNAEVSGMLTIQDKGGTGGTGGNGGPGGDGGDGQQGGRSKAYILDCDKQGEGPGTGGAAGDGGLGGLGGQGGDGGRGGTILLTTTSDNVSKWFDTVQLIVAGGDPGEPGKAGESGNPGNPGYGGRGAAGICQGKEADKMGQIGNVKKARNDSPAKSNPGPSGGIKRL